MNKFKHLLLSMTLCLITLFAWTTSASAFSLFPNEPSATSSNMDYREYIVNFYIFALPASALVAVVLIMIGGIIWITSAGDQGRIAKAKEFIINSIIGLIILAGTYVILGFINPALVILQPVGMEKLGAFGACYSNDDGSCQLTTEKNCPFPSRFEAGQECTETITNQILTAKAFQEYCDQPLNANADRFQGVSCTSQNPNDFYTNSNRLFEGELCRSTHKYSIEFDIPDAGNDCKRRCKSPCIPRFEIGTELICHCEPPNNFLSSPFSGE